MISDKKDQFITVNLYYKYFDNECLLSRKIYNVSRIAIKNAICLIDNCPFPKDVLLDSLSRTSIDLEDIILPGDVLNISVAGSIVDHCLQLKDEIDRYKNAIISHNKLCDDSCNPKACGYEHYSRSCPTCPKDWKIYL